MNKIKHQQSTFNAFNKRNTEIPSMQSRLAYNRPNRDFSQLVQASNNHNQGGPAEAGVSNGFNSQKQRAQQYRTPKSPDAVHKKLPPTTSQGFTANMAHEVLASKPESTFANLLLPSIPSSNQRSTKHIQKGAQLYNGSGGGDRVVIG